MITLKVAVIYILVSSILQCRCNALSCSESSSITEFFYICDKSDRLSDFQNLTSISVSLMNCPHVPVGLFVNDSYHQLRTLIISAHTSVSPKIRTFPSGVFNGLEGLTSLELRGFELITEIQPNALKPLSSIKCLHLKGFGANYLPFEIFGTFLRDLAGSPIENITMRNIRSAVSPYTILDFNTALDIPNVTLTSLAIDDTVINTINGRLSRVLPNLTSLSLSVSEQYGFNVDSAIDILMLMPNIRHARIYGYPGLAAIRYGSNHLEFQNDDDIKQIQYQYPEARCFWNYQFTLRPTLISLYLNSLSFFPDFDYSPLFADPICFHNSSNLELFDASQSPFPAVLPLIYGMLKLKTLNIQNTSIKEFSTRQLSAFPKLEILLLGNNDLGESVKNDSRSELFQNGTHLVTLDLAGCKIGEIPYMEFSQLYSLKHLNLSRNNMQHVDWHIKDTKLAFLNLSYNLIEQLFESFIQAQLIAIKAHQLNNYTTKLEIDLTGNPLSCLCNATKFIRWMQSTTVVKFTQLQSYTCLYPNGSWQNLLSVDADILEEQCNILSALQNNTACPCEKEIQQRYYNIRYSLAGFYCVNSDDVSVSMKTSNVNSGKSGCPDYRGSPVFIGSTVGGGAALLLAIMVAIFIAFYRYRRPREFQKMLDCLGPRAIVGYLMAILGSETSSDGEKLFSYDAFVAFDNEDSEIVKRCILIDLSKFGFQLVTEEQFATGTTKLEAILEAIEECRSIIFILTPSFVANNWCREIAIRASKRQHAIVPVVFAELHLDETDFLLDNIIKTCRPIHWCQTPSQTDSNEKSDALLQVVNRLEKSLCTQIVESAIESLK